MGSVITEALVLRRTPFGESSQIAEFMTADHGRVSLILKGVHRERSRMGGGADLLDHCRLVYHARRGSRSLAPLRERQVLSHHPGLRSREDLLAAGLWLVELLRALAQEGQAMPQLFDRALRFVQALDRRPPRTAVPALQFALEGAFLRMTGFEPVLDRCVSCDRRPTGHRSLRCEPGRGGLVCARCRQPDGESIPLSAAAARLAVRLAGTDPRELLDTTLAPELETDVRRLYHRVWLHVLERRPRCLPLALAHASAAASVSVADPARDGGLTG
jgi:DNA repair protein RecO (recombination protein O)